MFHCPHKPFRSLAGIVLVLWQMGVSSPVMAWGAPSLTQADTAIVSACAQPAASAPLDAEATALLTQGASADIVQAPLAAGRASQLPSGPSTVQLSQLLLAPGAGADTRSAVGPILFYVAAGSVTFYVGGVPQLAQVGEAILIPQDEYYTLANDGLEDAALLRLGVAPMSSGDQRIAVFDSPQDIPAADAALLPESRLLVRAAIAPLPTGDAWLILSCLTLPHPDLALSGLRHPGPVGLSVAAGPLGIQPDRQLPSGGCTVFAAGAPHDLRSLDAGATALLFAVIPAGDQLWLDDGASPNVPNTQPEDLLCGEAESTG